MLFLNAGSVFVLFADTSRPRAITFDCGLPLTTEVSACSNCILGIQLPSDIFQVNKL